MMLWISLSCTIFMLVYRKNEIENLKKQFSACCEASFLFNVSSTQRFSTERGYRQQPTATRHPCRKH